MIKKYILFTVFACLSMTSCATSGTVKTVSDEPAFQVETGNIIGDDVVSDTTKNFVIATRSGDKITRVNAMFAETLDATGNKMLSIKIKDTNGRSGYAIVGAGSSRANMYRDNLKEVYSMSPKSLPEYVEILSEGSVAGYGQEAMFPVSSKAVPSVKLRKYSPVVLIYINNNKINNLILSKYKLEIFVNSRKKIEESFATYASRIEKTVNIPGSNCDRHKHCTGLNVSVSGIVSGGVTGPYRFSYVVEELVGNKIINTVSSTSNFINGSVYIRIPGKNNTLKIWLYRSSVKKTKKVVSPEFDYRI